MCLFWAMWVVVKEVNSLGHWVFPGSRTLSWIPHNRFAASSLWFGGEKVETMRAEPIPDLGMQEVS